MFYNIYGNDEHCIRDKASYLIIDDVKYNCLKV